MKIEFFNTFIPPHKASLTGIGKLIFTAEGKAFLNLERYVSIGRDERGYIYLKPEKNPSNSTFKVADAGGGMMYINLTHWKETMNLRVGEKYDFKKVEVTENSDPLFKLIKLN